MFSNHIEHHLNVHCRRICALSPVEQCSTNDDPDGSMTRRSSSLRDDDDDADSYGSDDGKDTGGGTGNKKKLLQMIVGTCYPSNQHLEEHLPNLGENLIIKTLYDDEVHELYESTIYNHTSGEIWSMTTPSPTTSSTSGRSSNLVGTVGSPSSESIQVSLWKMPSVDGDDDDVHFEDDDGVPRTDLQLQHVLAVDDGDDSPPKKSQIVWSPHSLSDIVATTNTCSLQTFDVETGQEMFHASLQTFFDKSNSSNPLQLMPTVWDPLSEHQIALALENNLHIWDVRASSKSPSSMYRNLHSHSILSLDANPNQPHVYATGGQDGQFKIWDLRYGIVPQVTSKEEHLWDLPQQLSSSIDNDNIKQQWLYSKKCCGGLGAHTHWISSLKYNPYHDQLLLSSGTDTFVNLWRLSSVSSAPILETEDDMMNEGEVNVPFSSINPDYDFDTTTTSSPYNKEESKTTTGYRKGSTNYGSKRTMEEFQKPFDKWGTLDDFDQQEASLSNTKENKQRQNHHDGTDELVTSTKSSTTSKKTNPHLSDKLVTQFECQEAVYDMAWLDAWTYASVTWDGQLVVNSVPSQEKYKILL